jgi:transposase
VSVTINRKSAERNWSLHNRGVFGRNELTYPSSLTDVEWLAVEPLIPPARTGGNKRSVDMRQIVNAMLFVYTTGCHWTKIPKDLPPRTTINGYLHAWLNNGTMDAINKAIIRRD